MLEEHSSSILSSTQTSKETLTTKSGGSLAQLGNSISPTTLRNSNDHSSPGGGLDLDDDIESALPKKEFAAVTFGSNKPNLITSHSYHSLAGSDALESHDGSEEQENEHPLPAPPQARHLTKEQYYQELKDLGFGDDFLQLPALHFPSTNEILCWTAFDLLYFIGIAAPSGLAASFYASLTVDLEWPGNSLAKEILWGAVKAAAIVPTILGTNSAQALFTEIVNYWRTRGLSGFVNEFSSVKGALGMTFEVALPVLAASTASLMNAYAANTRLTGQVPDWISHWCTGASSFSAIVTNTRLTRTILIRYLKDLSVTDESGKRKILTKILDSLSNQVTELENKINHKEYERKRKSRDASQDSGDRLLSSDMLAEAEEQDRQQALEELVDLYLLVRNTRNIDALSYELFKKWQQAAPAETLAPEVFLQEKAFWLQMLSVGFSVTAAAIYTAPNLFSGMKAAGFADGLLSFAMPGMAIGLASYGINTMINTSSLTVLFDAVAKFWADPVKALRETKGWDIAQLALLSLYVFAQMGMVLEYPAQLSGLDPLAVQIIQLILTAFVAPGLGKFSLEGAFNRIRTYHDAYQSGLELIAGDKEQLKTLRAFNFPAMLLYRIQEGKWPDQDYINSIGGQGIPIHAMMSYIKGQLAAMKIKINGLDEKQLNQFYTHLDQRFDDDRLQAMEAGQLATAVNPLVGNPIVENPLVENPLPPVDLLMPVVPKERVESYAESLDDHSLRAMEEGSAGIAAQEIIYGDRRSYNDVNPPANSGTFLRAFSDAVIEQKESRVSWYQHLNPWGGAQPNATVVPH